MADKTGIEWTDATWNPTVGCSIISPGCTNCYAMRMAWRLGHIEKASGRLEMDGVSIPGTYLPTTNAVNGNPVWTGIVKLNEQALALPLRWKKPRRIFVNSMSDLFHENVPDEWIDRVFAVMALCPQHTFQVLTKRAERMSKYFHHHFSRHKCGLHAVDITKTRGEHGCDETICNAPFPLSNVWLGVSVEDQKRHDERVPFLRNTPAATRFISFEPLLGPIEADLTGIGWAIVGGESGPKARPMHPAWARSIRDQCKAASVPFFFKQWGEWAPVERTPAIDARCTMPAQNRDVWAWPDGTKWGWRSGPLSMQVGKKAAGRLLDGVEHNEFPEVRNA